MISARLKSIVKAFPERRLLVIGDLMLDEFIWGNVRRISPEAPVPVVDFASESHYPGGAANVARNLCEFTSHVYMMGVIGQDAGGERLRGLLESGGIDLSCVQQSKANQTTVKTRIIARQQQVVRVDRERREKLTPEQLAKALEQLDELLPKIDAVIVEDYGKGVVTQRLIDEVSAKVRAAGKVLCADPNPSNPLQWNGFTTVKPNRTEAFAAAGVPWQDPVDPVEEDTALLDVAAALIQKWETDQVLITLSEQGMLLLQSDGTIYHTPPRARKVFDLSGAGDTAIAVYALALCAGATPVEAAEIANHAGGVVVGKLGTATVTPEELMASFDEHGIE